MTHELDYVWLGSAFLNSAIDYMVTGSTAADYHPVDVGQVQYSGITDEGLDAEEPYRVLYLPQRVDPPPTIHILDAGSHLDVF